MRITKYLTLPLALLFMMACAEGQDIHYNYARGSNFASYKTYQWVELPASPPKVNIPGGLPNLPGVPSDIRGSASEDQLLDQDIKRAVDEQLAQKGLAKVEKNADLQITYRAAVHEEKSINLLGTGWAPGGLGWGGTSYQGQTSTIPIGTLMVGLYDPAKKQLIWRGDATKTIALKNDPNKNYQNLQKAIAKLFKNYPPQPGK